MTPEDLAQVKELIQNHDFEHEPWSFKKFFLGFFRAQNGAKALVIGFWLFLILFLGYATYKVFQSRFTHVQPTQAVGTNKGIIATKNEDKQGNSYSLLNLFNWR